jgi:hypothetical protein
MTDPDLTPEAVERFARTYNGGLSWDIVPNHEGEWVRYSDYATLSAERDALKAELAEAVDVMHGIKTKWPDTFAAWRCNAFLAALQKENKT